MSKETNKIETKEVEKPVHHKVGDLTLKCGKCGNVEILQEEIPGGISFILATVENADIKMKCGKCGNEMSLTFTGMSKERDIEFDKKVKAMEELKAQEAAAAEQAKEEAKTAELADVEAEEMTEEEAADFEQREAEFLAEQAEGELEVTDEAVEEETAAVVE